MGQKVGMVGRAVMEVAAMVVEGMAVVAEVATEAGEVVVVMMAEELAVVVVLDVAEEALLAGGAKL